MASADVTVMNTKVDVVAFGIGQPIYRLSTEGFLISREKEREGDREAASGDKKSENNEDLSRYLSTKRTGLLNTGMK